MILSAVPSPISRRVFAGFPAALAMLFGAALLGTGVPAHAQSANLLTNNPSFEVSPFGFAGHGVTTVPGWDLECYSFGGFGMRSAGGGEQPTDGNWLFYMGTGARATTAADSRADVTPGRSYRFAFDTTATDTDPTQSLGTTPYILFYDSSGNLLKGAPDMDVQIADATQSSYAAAWQTFSITAVAPPGAAKAGVQITTERGGYPNEDKRQTRLDNVRLTLVAETRNFLTARRFPRALQPGKPVSVTVRYAAAQNADVYVRLLRGNLLVGQVLRSVGTGRGTLDVPVPLPPTLPVGTNYTWEVRLQTAGGGTILTRQSAAGVFVDNTARTGNVIAPDDSNLVYTGRWDRRDSKTPTSYWPQSQLQARFSGTSVSLRTSKPGFEAQDLIVVVDGDDSTPTHVTVPAGSATVTLASGLADGVHGITVLQNGEINSGAWQVLGLQTDPGRGLLKPEPLPTRRVEIYGDSISVGGVPDAAVASPNPDNDGDYRSNTYHAFGAFAARALGADYRSVAKGGMGVAGGFVPYTMLDVYDKWTFDGYTPSNAATWDFTSWQPDVVIIAIGHNDQFGSNANFLPNYVTLVRNLRTKYPSADIFCTNTSMTQNSRFFLHAFASVQKAADLANDPKIHFQLFRPFQNHSGHPRLNDHQQMASGNATWNGLTDWIGDTIGW